MKNMRLIRKIDNYINEKEYSMLYKNNKLNIINYSEIVDFSNVLISVRYYDNIYYIEGNDLVISKMMENEILITGNINNIHFK